MSSSFDAAAAYLSTAPSAANLPSAVKLELYGLFKYVTVSPLPATPRPSIFDFTGRAKWDAWTAAGNAHTNKADAEEKYLDIARSLGWMEGAALPESKPSTSESQDIWDSDDEGAQSASRGGEPAGFGNAVSLMARSVEDESDTSLHGLVVNNDLEKLVSLVEIDPSTDLNTRDDFGYTPLHLAADRGHVAIVEFLLKKGVDSTVKDEDDLTALELAEAAGHERVVRLLSSPG